MSIPSSDIVFEETCARYRAEEPKRIMNVDEAAVHGVERRGGATWPLSTAPEKKRCGRDVAPWEGTRRTRVIS